MILMMWYIRELKYQIVSKRRGWTGIDWWGRGQIWGVERVISRNKFYFFFSIFRGFISMSFLFFSIAVSADSSNNKLNFSHGIFLLILRYYLEFNGISICYLLSIHILRLLVKGENRDRLLIFIISFWRRLLIRFILVFSCFIRFRVCLWRLNSRFDRFVILGTIIK